MLKSLDILIGLTVVMLALSMAVTVLTQFVTTVLNSRGRHLKRGLTDLLGQLDPGLTKEVSDRVAKAVLRHPLVSASGKRLGSVVHRDEFTRLLLHLAAGGGQGLTSDARAVLKSALENNGVKDPEGTLQKIRTASLELEAARPELAADVRHGLAILQEARTDLVAKVNHWFDQTMDRVSQRFTSVTRGITFGAAILVAVALQVDTVGLVNRLAADDKLRDAFLDRARSVQAQPPEGGEASQGAAVDREYLTFLAENGLISIPRIGDWGRRWQAINPVGVLITALLLSLGAPFWYNLLGRLLQLRSVLAQKDDRQRAARQGVEPVVEGEGAAKPRGASGTRGSSGA